MARAAVRTSPERDVWFAAGLRTPFTKAGGALATHDAIGLSVPVVKAMLAAGGRPDLMVWGAVIPNLTVSNIAREVMVEAGEPTTPASSTVMACSTSMMA